MNLPSPVAGSSCGDAAAQRARRQQGRGGHGTSLRKCAMAGCASSLVYHLPSHPASSRPTNAHPRNFSGWRWMGCRATLWRFTSQATRPAQRNAGFPPGSVRGAVRCQAASTASGGAFGFGEWNEPPMFAIDSGRRRRQSTTRRPLLPSAQAAAVCCLPPARSWLRQPCRPRTSGRRRSMRRATRCARRRRPRQTSEWLHRRLRLPAPALTLADLSSGTL